MIKETFLRDNKLVKHWSDRALWMKQVETDNEYPEAIDAVPCPFTYEEIEGKYVYDEWREEESYMKEMRVIYNDQVYESLVDENQGHVPSESAEWWTSVVLEG